MIKFAYQLGLLYAFDKLGALSPYWQERIKQVEAGGGAAGHSTLGGYGAAQRAVEMPGFAQTHAPMVPRQQAMNRLMETVPLVGGQGEWYTGQGAGTPAQMHQEISGPAVERQKELAKIRGAARSSRLNQGLQQMGNVHTLSPEARAALGPGIPEGIPTGMPHRVPPEVTRGTAVSSARGRGMQAARQALGTEATVAATHPMALERTIAMTAPKAAPAAVDATGVLPRTARPGWFSRLAAKFRPAARALHVPA